MSTGVWQFLHWPNHGPAAPVLLFATLSPLVPVCHMLGHLPRCQLVLQFCSEQSCASWGWQNHRCASAFVDFAVFLSNVKYRVCFSSRKVVCSMEWKRRGVSLGQRKQGRECWFENEWELWSTEAWNSNGDGIRKLLYDWKRLLAAKSPRR